MTPFLSNTQAEPIKSAEQLVYELAALLMNEFHFATMADSRESYRYVETVGDENEGIYVNDEMQFIEAQLEIVSAELQRTRSRKSLKRFGAGHLPNAITLTLTLTCST